MKTAEELLTEIWGDYAAIPRDVVIKVMETYTEKLSDEITGLKAELAMKQVDIDHFEDHEQKQIKILMDCIEAIDWAQTNLKPCEDAQYCDFFNILTNAKDAAEQFLNPPRALEKI